MLTDSAKQLLDHFKNIYNSTGRTEFIVDDYVSTPDYETVLKELCSQGYISEEQNNILGSVTLYTDSVK